jgi:hypothetical protein
MPIVDDYAAIAAELRRIQAERERPKPGGIPPKTHVAYVTRRGSMRISIEPVHPFAQRPARKDS